MTTAKQKPPTIVDVARRAGVSKSLVSLVIHNSPNVSEARRQAVKDAIAELGYRPNAVARSLVQQRSRAVGVVVSDLHNPFFADVAQGIEDAALTVDYRALLMSGYLDAGRETRAIETLLQQRLDGLIILGTMVDLAEHEAVAIDVPTVVVSAQMTSAHFDTVANDDRAGTRAVIDHLVSLGHRKIAHIDGGSVAGAATRRDTYLEAMNEHDLSDEIRVEGGSFTIEGGSDGMRRLLENGGAPTAVFVANDFAALGALQVLDRSGVRVPDEVSVVGYDNLAVSRMNRIALTTVEQPSHDMGRLAFEYALERIEGEREEARHTTLPPKLIVRATTAPPQGPV